MLTYVARRVVVSGVEVVTFLNNPRYAHPHEPETQSLFHLCRIHNVSPQTRDQFAGNAVTKEVSTRITIRLVRLPTTLNIACYQRPVVVGEKSVLIETFFARPIDGYSAWTCARRSAGCQQDSLEQW